jgi:hypothetical protein
MQQELLVLKQLVTEEMEKVQKQLDQGKVVDRRLNDKIESQSQDLVRHDLILETYKRNIRELYEQCEDIFKTRLESQIYEEEINRLKKEIYLTRSCAEKAADQINDTDLFLMKFLPFKIQNYITETLVNTFSRKNLPRLNDYTISKYKILKEELEADIGIEEFDKKQFHVP